MISLLNLRANTINDRLWCWFQIHSFERVRSWFLRFWVVIGERGPGRVEQAELGATGTGLARKRLQQIRDYRCQAHEGQAPWHFLYFLPLPHEHGSLRPIRGPLFRIGLAVSSSPPAKAVSFAFVNAIRPRRCRRRRSSSCCSTGSATCTWKLNRYRIVSVSIRSTLGWNRQ